MANLISVGTISTAQKMGSKDGFNLLQGSLHVLQHGRINLVLANDSLGLGHAIFPLANIDSVVSSECWSSYPPGDARRSLSVKQKLCSSNDFDF